MLIRLLILVVMTSCSLYGAQLTFPLPLPGVFQNYGLDVVAVGNSRQDRESEDLAKFRASMEKEFSDRAAYIKSHGITTITILDSTEQGYSPGYRNVLSEVAAKYGFDLVFQRGGVDYLQREALLNQSEEKIISEMSLSPQMKKKALSQWRETAKIYWHSAKTFFWDSIYQKPSRYELGLGISFGTAALVINFASLVKDGAINTNSMVWPVVTVYGLSHLFQEVLFNPLVGTYNNYLNNVVGEAGEFITEKAGNLLPRGKKILEASVKFVKNKVSASSSIVVYETVQRFALSMADQFLLHISSPQVVKGPWDPVFWSNYWKLTALSAIPISLMSRGIFKLQQKGWLRESWGAIIIQVVGLTFPLGDAYLLTNNANLKSLVVLRTFAGTFFWLAGELLPDRSAKASWKIEKNKDTDNSFNELVDAIFEKSPRFERLVKGISSRLALTRGRISNSPAIAKCKDHAVSFGKVFAGLF